MHDARRPLRQAALRSPPSDPACPFGYAPLVGWSAICRNCFRPPEEHDTGHNQGSVGGRVVMIYDSLKRYRGGNGRSCRKAYSVVPAPEGEVSHMPKLVSSKANFPLAVREEGQKDERRRGILCGCDRRNQRGKVRSTQKVI